LIVINKSPSGDLGAKGGWGLKIFCISQNLPIFVATNQIFLPVKGVWFLLRRAERLGSAKPWQPIRCTGTNSKRGKVPKPNPGKPGDDKNKTRKK